MEILAIIPARGGSKGIKRKNLALLGDKPLIVHTIEAAKASKSITRVVVSTEDSEIAKVSKECGADVVKRPLELAADETATEPVMSHVIESLTQTNYSPDIIVLLQPTSPFRTSETIDKTVQKVLDGADSALTVCDDYGYYWAKADGDSPGSGDAGISPLYSERKRRQDMTAQIRENGAVYAVKREVFITEMNRVGKHTEPVFMDSFESIEIDSDFDLWLARKYVEWKSQSACAEGHKNLERSDQDEN